MRASPIYSDRFLLCELHRAASILKRDDYARFHADMVNQLSESLRFHMLTVNILHVRRDMTPDGEITSAVAHLPKSVIENYQRSLLFDDFTPLTFKIPGSAMFTEALRPMDEWEDKKLYKLHCTPYGIYWVAGVSYLYPHQKPTFVAIDYIREKGVGFSQQLTEEDVEYISFPFYLGWLCQYGAICSETLKDWLNLMVGMPPARFRVVRGLAAPGVFTSTTLADNLGNSRKTLYRHIELAFERLLQSNSDMQLLEGNASRILALTKAYRFLEFGAASVGRTLPVRN